MVNTSRVYVESCLLIATRTTTTTSASGGGYYFKITTRVGADGFVLPQVAQWSPGQDWYLTVHATPGAQWTLMTGEPYVEQLPALAADATSGTNGIIGPEGMRFIKTTISAGTLGWRLGLNGAGNTILVDNTRAPVLYGSAGGGYYDWSGVGQLLLVLNYINVGNQHIVGVIGNPGDNITLDSRQQAVTDLAFPIRSDRRPREFQSHQHLDRRCQRSGNEHGHRRLVAGDDVSLSRGGNEQRRNRHRRRSDLYHYRLAGDHQRHAASRTAVDIAIHRHTQHELHVGNVHQPGQLDGS